MRYVVARKKIFKVKNNVKRLLSKEKINKLHKISSCYKFKKNCEVSKKKFIRIIKRLKMNGKRILGTLHQLKVLLH